MLRNGGLNLPAPAISMVAGGRSAPGAAAPLTTA